MNCFCDVSGIKRTAPSVVLGKHLQVRSHSNLSTKTNACKNMGFTMDATNKHRVSG